MLKYQWALRIGEYTGVQPKRGWCDGRAAMHAYTVRPMWSMINNLVYKKMRSVKSVSWCQNHRHCLDSCNSKNSPQISSISNNWELVRISDSYAPSQINRIRIYILTKCQSDSCIPSNFRSISLGIVRQPRNAWS